MSQPEVFFSTLFEPVPMCLRVSARVLDADRRHAEVVELLTADEMQRAVFDRALDIGDRDELRNGLASFLASRFYRATGRFSRLASGLLVPGSP